jgi:peptidoglycan hydrolase-like protein with peptidoglycan-binding domain
MATGRKSRGGNVKGSRRQGRKERSSAKAPARRLVLSLRTAGRGAQHPDIDKVQRFLTRFGYLDTTITPGTLDPATSGALKTFQRMQGLSPTGTLTGPTAKAMEAGRCGTPDVGLLQSVAGGASGSFVLRGCGYNRTRFTYRFANGTADIAGTQERQAVRNAFATWAAALCGVTFVESTSAPTDFEIAWRTGSHGDGSAFDGAGNTLAHAFYPPPCGGAHAGEMHFDDAETWSLTGAGSTFDTETVALHEIGHLLGLDHSSVAGSVMFPSYGGVRRALTQDDVDGVRRLYPFVCRRGDSGSSAGFVAEIAAVRHGQRQVVTAVRTQAGTLKLIAWSVGVDGSISRTGDSGSQAGAATSIAIARNGGDQRFVTACRASSGDLKLIAWTLNAAGSTLLRTGDSGSAAGTASLIAITSLGNDRFVTACRTSSGKLKLIGWRLEATGSLARLADSGSLAGTVTEVALLTLAGNRVLTAVRTASGNLRLITWSVSDSSIARLADSGTLAGSARAIRVTLDAFNHPVTALKAGDDSLKLISWRIAPGGGITRLADSGHLAGETNGHDISITGGRIVTGVRTASGNLKVIIWETDANGVITRVGDSAFLAGDAKLVTQCEELPGGPPMVTSVRTASNSLKLISWSTP